MGEKSCEHRQLIILGRLTDDIECQDCGARWYYCTDGWTHYQLKPRPEVEKPRILNPDDPETKEKLRKLRGLHKRVEEALR